MHTAYKKHPIIVAVLFGLFLSACGTTNNPSVAQPVGSTATASTVASNTTQAEQIPTAVTSFEIPTPIPNPSAAPIEPAASIPPAPQQAQRNGKTLFESTFGPDAQLIPWKITDTAVGLSGPSVWRIENGILEPYSDASDLPGSFGSAITIGEPTWANYQVNAVAYNQANDTFGLVARASEQGFYIFQIWSDGSLNLNRYNAQTGEYSPLAHAKIEADQVNNQWLQLQLIVQDATITAKINNTQLLQATDTTFAQGQAGMYGYVMGELAFDNFSVNALAEQ